MARNYQYNRSSGGYPQGGSYASRNGGGNFNGYQNNGYQRQNSRPVKKHSGASFKSIEGGLFLVSGWNYSKSKGMVKLYARPYKGTKISESKTGKRWANLFCTVTYMNTGNIVKCSAMLDLQTKRLYVKELNMIASTKGKGGYFGRQFGGQ